MPGQRVCQLALSAALLLAAQLIPLTISFGSMPCQTTNDPNGLLASITKARHRSKMSTDMLKLMLPCSGTLVSAGSLAQVFSAGFSSEQIELIIHTFVVSKPVLSDVLQVVRAPIADTDKELVLSAKEFTIITRQELQTANLEGLSPAQMQFLAKHLLLLASEPDLPFLFRRSLNSKVSTLVQQCLMPLRLSTEQSVSLLAAYPYRRTLLGKIVISSPVLWAIALKGGFSVADLSMLLNSDECGAWDVVGAFQRNGISNIIATEFLLANRKHLLLSDQDVDRLSKSSLSNEQITQIIQTLKHPALQLYPSSVAQLKARGIADEAILALTREWLLALSSPSIQTDNRGPSITADNYEDPLSELFSPSTEHGIKAFSDGNKVGSGYGGGDTDGIRGSFRIGGDVSAPVLVSKVEPEYSDEALKAKFSGSVLLAIIVGADGIPREIHVIRQLGFGLDEKAIEAVMRWRFRPGMKGGRPVATQAQVEINFHLNESGPTREAGNIASVKDTVRQNKPSKLVVNDDLRVEIVQVRWNTSEWGANGFGKGNLLGNPNKQGFDFTFSCSRPFLPSDGGGYYPGKWKKPNSKLVIMTTEIGNAKKHDFCELKVSLEPFAYEVRNSPLATVPIRP